MRFTNLVFFFLTLRKAKPQDINFWIYHANDAPEPSKCFAVSHFKSDDQLVLNTFYYVSIIEIDEKRTGFHRAIICQKNNNFERQSSLI